MNFVTGSSIKALHSIGGAYTVGQSKPTLRVASIFFSWLFRKDFLSTISRAALRTLCVCDLSHFTGMEVHRLEGHISHNQWVAGVGLLTQISVYNTSDGDGFCQILGKAYFANITKLLSLLLTAL